MTDARISQVVHESAIADDAAARVSQAVAEVLVADDAEAQVSQAVLELGIADASPALVSQFILECLYTPKDVHAMQPVALGLVTIAPVLSSGALVPVPQIVSLIAVPPLLVSHAPPAPTPAVESLRPDGQMTG
jgi:hypothetical protein